MGSGRLTESIMQTFPNLMLPAGRRRIAAIASVLAAMAAAVLDASSINIALPVIAEELRIKPSIATWLVIAYQGALVASLMPLAAIGERYGYRRAFVAGTCLFALCGGAATVTSGFGLLIALRFLQGVGSAAIMALGVALLRQTVAQSEFGKAISWNAMAVAIMSAAGPSIGASLLELGSWRFVFTGGVALALMSLALGCALPSRPSAGLKLDHLGILAYFMFVPLFVIAVGTVGAWPMGSAFFLLSGSVGVWALIRRDRFRAHPFLPLELFRNPTFNRSVFASVACFIGLSLALLILPFALQARLNTNPFETAMLMTPWPLAVLLTTPVTTRLLDRVNSAILCAAGGICLTCGFGILTVASTALGVAAHLLGIILCGIGFGLFQTPNNRNMFLAAPVDRSASAGGVQGTARLTGQVAGALIASILLSLLTVQIASPVAFSISAMATLVATMISFRRG